MKRYVNKSKYLQKIVFFTDKKKQQTKTRFLRRGQSISSDQEVKTMDSGIKVKEAETKTKAQVEKTQEQEQ